jgi:transketolase
MRKAFTRALTEIASQDSRVALVTGDLGFQVFDEFHERFGPRYINVGVAEAQMIYTAAGLATVGWRPVAYSIASFATARPFEQIRYCVSYPNLPVVIIGAGRGYLYSTSGVSHHAADDHALMSLLPGMTVVSPGDPTEVTQLFPQLFKLSGPSYFSVGRFGEPSYEAPEPAILGRARLLREGEQIAVISTGEIANEVLKALELLETEKIFPIAYQMHTVKPLDTVTLDLLSKEVHTIVVVEEHVPNGGLWAAICAWRAGIETAPRLLRLGPPDTFALGNLRQDDLRRQLKFDANAIANTCRQSWQKRQRDIFHPVDETLTSADVSSRKR